MNRTLAEIIQDLQRINEVKRSMTLGSLRESLEELSKELEKIADSLIV